MSLSTTASRFMFAYIKTLAFSKLSIYIHAICHDTINSSNVLFTKFCQNGVVEDLFKDLLFSVFSNYL